MQSQRVLHASGCMQCRMPRQPASPSPARSKHRRQYRSRSDMRSVLASRERERALMLGAERKQQRRLLKRQKPPRVGTSGANGAGATRGAARSGGDARERRVESRLEVERFRLGVGLRRGFFRRQDSTKESERRAREAWDMAPGRSGSFCTLPARLLRHRFRHRSRGRSPAF